MSAVGAARTSSSYSPPSNDNRLDSVVDGRFATPPAAASWRGTRPTMPLARDRPSVACIGDIAKVSLGKDSTETDARWMDHCNTSQLRPIPRTSPNRQLPRDATMKAAPHVDVRAVREESAHGSGPVCTLRDRRDRNQGSTGSGIPPTKYTDRSEHYRLPRARKTPNPSVASHPRQMAYRTDLGARLSSLSIDDIPRPLWLRPAKIRDVQFVGGYKWIEPPPGHSGPAIVVPGVPDIWIGCDRPEKEVGEDKALEGNVEIVNYNAARVPAGYMAFEPLFHSLMDPKDLSDVSVLTGRSNLKKLFCFCTPSRRQDSFRIDTEILPGTEIILLHRWEMPQASRPRAPVHRHLAFHEANTLAVYRGADRTPGCHRVVKYNFGGLVMMVNSDVGAALPWEGMFPRPMSDDEDALSMDTEIRTCATFGSNENSAVLFGPGPEYPGPAHKTSSGITIVPGQVSHPPQGHLISLKTRIAPLTHPQDLCTVDHLEELYAGLHFGQIPNLYLARHVEGHFAPDTQKFVMQRGKLAELDVKFDRAVRKVRHILGWMVDVTMRHGKAGFVGHHGVVNAFVSERESEKLSDEAWETILRSRGRDERRFDSRQEGRERS